MCNLHDSLCMGEHFVAPAKAAVCDLLTSVEDSLETPEGLVERDLVVLRAMCCVFKKNVTTVRYVSCHSAPNIDQQQESCLRICLFI